MLGFISNVAAVVMNLFGGIFGTAIEGADWGSFPWLKSIAMFLDNALIPVIIIVAVGGGIWAVILGVNLARAETADKATEAKKRLLNVVFALVAVILLIFLLTFVVSNLGGWLTPANNPFE